MVRWFCWFRATLFQLHGDGGDENLASGVLSEQKVFERQMNLHRGQINLNHSPFRGQTVGEEDGQS